MAPATAIVWFRRDLRLGDNPALSGALAGHDRVVPVFILDPGLLRGRFPSPARAAFLHGCLRDLTRGVRERGGAMVVREGRPWVELPRLAREARACTVHWADDVSPYARARDGRVRTALERAGVEVVVHPGNFVAAVASIRTFQGRPYRVFTPFYRTWLTAPRRALLDAPEALAPPGRIRRGRLPALAALGALDPPQRLVEPGEDAARRAMAAWLDDGLARYAERHDRLAGGTSRLSPYLHFGCLSARELDAAMGRRRGSGAVAYRRQLCWRDFFAHVLLHHPESARRELQERYRSLEWDEDDELLDAWRAGRTGYPLVDAAMRELLSTGWMHNRARLVVGSFLTKDLHLDWRRGEEHFMRTLIDGDEASNNGNWQWIASVGADPAPYFRRLLSPVAQQRRHDPDGDYVRRWVPELGAVPDAHLAEPWRMTKEEQSDAGCILGHDYPNPIVDHATERERAIQRYRAAGGGVRR
ncbi:MAG TPA: deoxyribodipyrimidine photo-lyase [Solirubrobacteraceae bacterium]